jgi:hypothetical protein
MKPVQQAELLLRLAENNEDRGEDVNAEINRLGREHALALLEEQELLTKALEINRIGRERFAHFMPRPTQHPGQSAIGRSLADQRAALIQGGKDEAQAQKEQRPTANQRP